MNRDDTFLADARMIKPTPGALSTSILGQVEKVPRRDRKPAPALARDAWGVLVQTSTPDGDGSEKYTIRAHFTGKVLGHPVKPGDILSLSRSIAEELAFDPAMMVEFIGNHSIK